MVRPVQEIGGLNLIATVDLPVTINLALFPYGVYQWFVLEGTAPDEIVCIDVVGSIDGATITLNSPDTDYTGVTLRVEGYVEDE